MSPLSVEQCREKLKAEVLLAQLLQRERLAELSETDPTVAVRAHCALRYRELLGIDPSQRQALRQALEQTRRGLGASVAVLLDHFGRQASGSSSFT